MCFTDFKLVTKLKNWCLAKQYCWDHGLGDLVSTYNITEELKEAGKGQTFWIGQTMHDEWIWEDKSCSTFRDWAPASDANATATVVTSTYSEQMMKHGLELLSSLLCSKGKVVNTKYMLILLVNKHFFSDEGRIYQDV